MTLNKHLVLFLKVGISVSLIAFLLSQIDPVSVAASLSQMMPAMIVLAFVLILLQAGPAVLRWLAVLEAIGAPLSFPRGCRIILISIFFNQTLPSTVGGDAVRGFLAHRAGLTVRGAINGVLLERVVTVLTMVALVLVFQLLLSDEARNRLDSWILSMNVALFWVALLGLGLFLSLDRVTYRVREWRLVRALNKLVEDAQRLFYSPGRILKALAWAVIAHLMVSIAGYILALGLDIEIGLIECQFFVTLANLISMIPVSIAGWGMREGAMVVLFGMLGIAPEKALALSVLYGLIVVASGIPGGVLWFFSGNYRQKEATRVE